MMFVGKISTNMAKNRKCVFGQKYHSFEIFETLKNKYGILLHQ